MIDVTAFITQSLSPAFVLSALGLLTISLHNRMLTISSRIRGINDEIRRGVSPTRFENTQLQIRLLMERVRYIRNSLFLLYGAMGLMVFTAIAIALHELGIFFPEFIVPVWAFLGGLVLMFIALLMEAWAVILNLRTLELDTEYALSTRKSGGETMQE